MPKEALPVVDNGNGRTGASPEVPGRVVSNEDQAAADTNHLEDFINKNGVKSPESVLNHQDPIIKS